MRTRGARRHPPSPQLRHHRRLPHVERLPRLHQPRLQPCCARLLHCHPDVKIGTRPTWPLRAPLPLQLIHHAPPPVATHLRQFHAHTLRMLTLGGDSQRQDRNLPLRMPQPASSHPPAGTSCSAPGGGSGYAPLVLFSVYLRLESPQPRRCCRHYSPTARPSSSPAHIWRHFATLGSLSPSSPIDTAPHLQPLQHVHPLPAADQL